MSNASRYLQLVKSASLNDDRASMLDAYYQYQDTQCLHPVNVRVVDNHTQTKRTIQVPCGSCWHCQQTKINEWCTRMYAHAEDFKHVYFVTLTYRTIHDVNNNVNSLLFQKLGQAVWHKDANNYNKSLCYRPCLLVKKHYQDFLKRLRKNTGLTDLTYVCAGEYGHTYGAPHFHFIFFTNGTLTKQDIVRAWSLCLWRSDDGSWKFRTNQVKNGHAYNFPLGRVDFNDLVENGTFNKDFAIKVDGTYMNAANCFAYVCKYVVKRETANLTRVNYAYNSLYHKKRVVKIGADEVDYYHIRTYLLNKGITYNNTNINTLHNLSYEKIIYEPSEDVSQHGLLRTKCVEKENFRYVINLLPEIYHEFRDTFRPFCEFSRGTPIGSIYAKRNIQEFAKGVFTKPLLQSKGFAVPRYFRTKAHEYLYGLRKLRKTIKGQSLVITGLVDLQRRFFIACNDALSLRENLGNSMPYGLVSQALHDDRSLFVDAYSKERILIYNNYAQHYKYNRHTREFNLTRAVPVVDWIKDQVSRLQDELLRAKLNLRISTESHQMSEKASLIMLDHGFSQESIINSYEIRQESIRRENDLLYHQSHCSAE